MGYFWVGCRDRIGYLGELMTREEHEAWIEKNTKLCTKRNVRLHPKNCVEYHRLPKVKATRVDGFDSARVNKVGCMPIECEDCPGLPMPDKLPPPKAIMSEKKATHLYNESAKRYFPPIKTKHKFYDKEDAKRLTKPPKVLTKEEIEEYQRRNK